MKCHYCERFIPDELISVDHKVPTVAGGSNKKTNKVLACKWCNQIKSARDYNTFRRSLREFLTLEGVAEEWRAIADFKTAKAFQSKYDRWFNRNYCVHL